MQSLSQSFFLALILAASLPLSAGPAHADGYPDKPIRFIIPFPPGGSNDVLGRYIGVKLTQRLGQQVVIDNRGGANGIIGAELAASAPADGYTMLMVSTSWVMNAAVRPLPYDVVKSFDPISMIGSSPNSIVVYPGWGVNSLKELVARAKSRPASIFYGSTGIGGFNHFGGELFKKIAKVDLVMVPYKGGGPAMIDVMAGQIPMMFTSVTQVLPHVRTGKIKMLAVGSTKRSPVLPDVPTVIESGFPGYDVAVWWGVVAPAGTPRPEEEKLRQEITAVIAEPETQKRLLADAAEPKNLMPAQMRKMFIDEVKKWRDVARVAGISVK